MTYSASLNKMPPSRGDGVPHWKNRNDQGDVFAGSQSFASGRFNESATFSGAQHVSDASKTASLLVDGGARLERIHGRGGTLQSATDKVASRRVDPRLASAQHPPSAQPYLRKEAPSTSSKFLPGNRRSSQSSQAGELEGL